METQESPPQGSVARTPVLTWVFMGLSVVSILTWFDWTDSGRQVPIWALPLPVVLGAIGCVFAIRARRPAWAVVSALWGFFVIQALVMIATLIWGP